MADKISRSTGEAYLAIAISIIVVVFPVNWLLKIILMCVVGCLGTDIAFRHPKTIDSHWLKKAFLAAFGILVLTVLSYQPIRKQYLEDKPKPQEEKREESKKESTKIENPLLVDSLKPQVKRFKEPPNTHPKLLDLAEGKNITVDVGPSPESNYAYETRFILTNRNSEQITNVSYLCATQKIDPNSKLPGLIVKLAPAPRMALGPIADLPSGDSHSIYCDFVADLWAGSVNSFV
jgi:hypothetical protein